ncbi:glutamine amido transferase [Haloferula helveola]|uniref:Glutamine amido transferase n=1 Tax=Haloferula helveola TaxID=490095 RepID=A0ABM7RBY2_9BACT|nr:glutamine amido transferase [Haloferula helveola]
MKCTRRAWIASAATVVAGVLGFGIGRWTDEVPARGTAPDAPLIGIASLTDENYSRAVRQAGGIPIVLPNSGEAAADVDRYLELLDGLLLPGGWDIPPEEYGEERHETVEVLDDDRYQFERKLSRAWIERSDKPLLGICLGGQWINVSSGGTLVQDIPSEFDGLNHRSDGHAVILEPDSRLARIFGATELDVNSSHHQAVDKLGKGLRIVARCPDGVVEATETADPDRFLIGVQWHPEKLMPENEQQTKLLKAFVEAARAGREERVVR